MAAKTKEVLIRLNNSKAMKVIEKNKLKAPAKFVASHGILMVVFGIIL